MDTMTPDRNPGEVRQSLPAPRLLVEMPSRPRVFFGNLRDRIFPRRLPPLELLSAPAPFWADVFVQRALPMRRFVQSCACHVVGLALLIGVNRFFALHPEVVARPAFEHAQVIYYPAAEYLPPLDTRSAQAPRPAKVDPAVADPAFAPQPIISVPREADNRSQTIVTPPSVKLQHEVALPNVVAWSEQMSQRMQKPRLAIPPPPLTLAGDITRIGPQLENSVVAPPPDAEQLAHRRNSSALQASVVAPPPRVQTAAARPLGDLEIGRSSVIAPAPQLPVPEQHARAGWRSSLVGAPVVPPPPSVSAGSSGESFGTRGHIIALNLHPAAGAPPDPPPGNRRGNFAAAPDGHSGAAEPATPDSSANGSGKAGSGGSSRKAPGDLPAGLYVGKAAGKTSPMAGDPGKVSNSAQPYVVASVRPPRVSSAPSRPVQAGSVAKLSEAERAVFGDRKFYALTLNMPNLNSAVGSWIIHFAEISHDSAPRDSTLHDSAAPAEDLSQPMATRKVDPAYPLQLMRENVTGTVILYAVIRADGSVGNVRVLRGVDDRLDGFASQALAKWQFQPAMRNGSPVEVEATFQIPFRVARVGSDF